MTQSLTDLRRNPTESATLKRTADLDDRGGTRKPAGSSGLRRCST
jgi:hypothetical protein